MRSAAYALAVLFAAALCACAARHELKQPAAATVGGITVHGPLEGADLSDALSALAGRPLEPALLAEAEALIRDYYAWLEWQEIQVEPAAQLDGAGLLRIVVRGRPPDDAPLPPAAWLEAPPAAESGTVASAVPAPSEAGGARAEDPLDARLVPWLALNGRVLVDESQRRLYLRRDDGSIVSYAVAVGTARTPTPARPYTIEAITHQPTWYPPASIRREHAARGKPLPRSVPPGRGNPLGSYFVRLQNSIGIHGTNQPRSIGRAASHGCIRMHDRDVRELVQQLRPGDAVLVVPDLARSFQAAL